MTAITKLVHVNGGATTLTDAVASGSRAIINIIGYTSSGGTMSIQLDTGSGAQTIYSVATTTSFTLKNLVLKSGCSLVATNSGSAYLYITGFTELDE